MLWHMEKSQWQLIQRSVGYVCCCLFVLRLCSLFVSSALRYVRHKILPVSFSTENKPDNPERCEAHQTFYTTAATLSIFCSIT